MTPTPSALNPYSKFLGEAAPYETIAYTPHQIAELIANLPPARIITSPARGKWSIRDILCHLADCEIAFAFRLRQAAAEPNHVIQPFDQEKWAGPYGLFDAASALAVFTTLRDWNCKLITTIPPEGFEKPVTHPERGEMKFRTIVETMAGHDINHVKQIEALAA